MSKKSFKTRLASAVLALAMLASSVPAMPMVSHAEVEPANWVDDEETARYWPIPHQGRLVKVSTAETLKNPSLRYIGGYTRPDGREVVRLAFAGYSSAVTDVWLRLILKPDNNLNQLIDWDESGIGKKRTEQFPNNHDGYNFNKEFIKFEPLSAQQGGSGNLRYVSVGEKGTQTVRTGLLGVNFETPIDLVLKKGATVKTLKNNPLIQMRLMDSNFERIYSTTIAENEEVPYSSYTMSTFVPVRVDLKKGILNTDVARNTENTFQSASSYVKYNEEKGYIDVYTRRTQGAVGSTADSGGAFNAADKRNEGDYGFMQTFDKSFIDILKPQDASGTVAQIFAANRKDQVSYPSSDPTVPLPANRVDYSINDIEKIGDVGVVKVTNNTPDKTFMRTGTTLTGYGTSTVVRYFIDKDKLKESFGSTDIVSYEFFSTVFATNPTGIEEFKSVPRDEDIDLRRGDTIDIEFDGRRDFLTLGTFDTNGSVIQVGDDQYKFGIRTTGDKTKYAGQMRKMTVSVPFDIKIKKETPLTIFSRKTKRMQVSPGMKVTFNYSALDDSGNKVTKQKTYRFERPLKEGYTRNEKGEIFKDGQKINNPQQSLFIDNHDPLMVSRQENFGGGILTRTADAPDIDEIFTDSKYLTGRSKYDRVYVYPYDANKNEVSTAKRLGTITASDQKIEMNVNGDEVQGFEWTSENNDKDNEIDSKYWAKKDMPIYFTNQDVLANALESENPVVEQVQARVTFDLNRGTIDKNVKSYKGVDKEQKPGTEHAYITDRSSDQEEIVRIVPMNKKFANAVGYKPNGFEGDDVELKDHNGKNFVENIANLEKEVQNAKPEDKKKLQAQIERTREALNLRRFVTEKPSQPGRTFLGWTTQKLQGTPEEVTNEFKKLKEAESVDQYGPDKKLIFTSKSPVVENMTVYAAYGSPIITFHSNPPADLNKEDETVLQSLTEQNLTDGEVRLERNYNDPKFDMNGYSLVGYSVNKDADIPDENITGKGLNKDEYLRDGDVLKLKQDKADKGFDLYAVWKPNYNVDVTKVWGEGTNEAKDKEKISVGLLARPAVGTAGSEVVDQNAVYRPVPDTIKALSTATDNKLSWTDLPSYDENGHRMSYIAVELTQTTAEKFKQRSVEYSDYGATIVPTKNGIPGHKVQLMNTDGVDSMSAATIRSHYNKDGNKVNVNNDKSLGYFDTYGYSIVLQNTKVAVQPPRIEAVDYGANSVVVNKVGNPKTLVITLPDNTQVKLNNGESGLAKDGSSTFEGDVAIDRNKVTLTLVGKKTFKAGEVIKAYQTKDVGESELKSEEAKTIVKEQPKAHIVEEIKQLPKDKEGNSSIDFIVPNNVLLPPKAGSTYTLGYITKDGNNETFHPIQGVNPVTLTEDINSDNDTEVHKQFIIPADKFEEINKLKKDGTKLVIQSEEDGKITTHSDGFDLDLTAPTATATAEDDLWRRWVNIDLTDFKEENQTIVINYKDTFGDSHTLRIPDPNEAKATINMLKRFGFENYEVSLEDKFGNENTIRPDYNKSLITVIWVARFRLNKDFVQVKPTEPNTTITVRVFKPEHMKDIVNMTDGYEGKAEAIGNAKISKTGKYTKINLTGQNGAYKIKRGDIIEVKGLVEETGARTNPYVKEVR